MVKLKVKRIKVIFSIILAVSMLVVSGCSAAPQTAFKYGDMEISAGMYNYFLMQAMATLEQKVADANSDNADYTAPTQKELLKLTTDGMSNSDWVKKEAAELCGVYFAVNEIFKNRGLSVDDDERSSIKTYADYIMSYDAAFYETNGIGSNSVYEYELNGIMRDRIFTSMYSDGGERAVPDDILRAAFEQKYAKVEIMTIEKSADADADAAAKVTAEEYLKRYEAGEKIEDLIFELQSATAEEGKTVEKPEEGSAITFLDITNATTDASKAIVGADLNKIQMVEDAYYFYIFKRLDVLVDPADFEDYKEVMLINEKEDEFDAYLREEASRLNIETNQSVINSYTPEKLKLA